MGDDNQCGLDRLINKVSFNKDTVGDNVVDAWRDCLAAFFQVEPQKSDAPVVDTHINIYSLHDIVCIEQEFNAAQFIRDSKRIAHFDNDCIGLCLWLDGKNDVDNAGKTVSAKGSAFLMDIGKPVVTNATTSRCLSMALPKPLVAQYGLNPNTLAGVSLAADNYKFHILQSVLLATFNSLPYIQQSESESIAHGLVALICSLFSQAGGQASQESSTAFTHATHKTVLDYIEKNLANPQLGINMIVRALPYSRSVLYRQFIAYGGIAVYIRQQRLKRCYKAITLAQYQSHSIFSIAQSWGFSNSSHFGRVFKAYFGLSPGEARERAVTEHYANPQLTACKDEIKRVTDWFSSF
jgi:AraC-like DNA-binding protein